MKELKETEKAFSYLLSDPKVETDELKDVVQEVKEAIGSLQIIYDEVLKKNTALSQMGRENSKEKVRIKNIEESGGYNHNTTYGHGGQ